MQCGQHWSSGPSTTLADSRTSASRGTDRDPSDHGDAVRRRHGGEEAPRPVDARAGHRASTSKLVLVAICRRDPGTGRVALLRNETKAHDERRRGSPDDPVSPTAMLLVMRSRQSVAERKSKRKSDRRSSRLPGIRTAAATLWSPNVTSGLSPSENPAAGCRFEQLEIQCRLRRDKNRPGQMAEPSSMQVSWTPESRSCVSPLRHSPNDRRVAPIAPSTNRARPSAAPPYRARDRIGSTDGAGAAGRADP